MTDGWLTRFKQRHPRMSLRCGDATAHIRMTAVNEENNIMLHYFSLLKNCLEENDTIPDCAGVKNIVLQLIFLLRR